MQKIVIVRHFFAMISYLDIIITWSFKNHYYHDKADGQYSPVASLPVAPIVFFYFWNIKSIKQLRKNSGLED